MVCDLILVKSGWAAGTALVRAPACCLVARALVVPALRCGAATALVRTTVRDGRGGGLVAAAESCGAGATRRRNPKTQIPSWNFGFRISDFRFRIFITPLLHFSITLHA